MRFILLDGVDLVNSCPISGKDLDFGRLNADI
jgi:hypothetical protein